MYEVIEGVVFVAFLCVAGFSIFKAIKNKKDKDK